MLRPQAQLIGFTITNAGQGAILCLSNASPTLLNCQFRRNSNPSDGGGAVIMTILFDDVDDE